MTKLTDTQLVVLSAASQRNDRLALPLPRSLKGGAAHKVVNALLAKGFLMEVEANRKMGDQVWLRGDEDHDFTLIITDAGFTAMGIEDKFQTTKLRKSEQKPVSTARKIRGGTKQALVLELLRRLEGATIAEIVAATSWASHTSRGFLAGALKKKLGLTIASENNETRGRYYRLID